MMALFRLISSIPGIGKHKTIIGSVITAVSAADKLIGTNLVPDGVNEVGQFFLGTGLVDKGRKSRKAFGG